MANPALLVLAVFALITPVIGQAAITGETFYFEGIPTEQQVRDWSALPGRRSYLLNLGSVNASDLAVLHGLENAATLGIEVSYFPYEGTLPAWRSLTAHHQAKGVTVQFIGLNAGLPTADEITRLNQTGVSEFIFVLNGYYGAETFARLGDLRGKVSLTFAAGNYPRFGDREAFRALPAGIPLLFVTDYWPGYSHMDLFNLIPQEIKLRVVGSFPPESSLEYLHNIKRLRSVSVVTDFDPATGGEWSGFRDLPVNWTCRDWVPSEKALSDFASAANRTLTIDEQSWSSTREELDRLERASVPVHRIRTAPAYATSPLMRSATLRPAGGF